MDPWLIVLVLVGLGVIVFGALFDRSRNQRRAAEMLAPPQRAIPQLRRDAPAPRYVSDLQARRPPANIPVTDLSHVERTELAAQLTRTGTTVVPAGFASSAFVTDPTGGWAVLDEPMVLLCGDPVDSIRELLPTLEKMVGSRTPLVVVTPAMATEVRATLEVNQIQRTLSVLVVLAGDEADRRTIADRSGATVTDRSDRQAGTVARGDLGRCARWVAGRRDSYLIATAPNRAG